MVAAQFLNQVEMVLSAVSISLKLLAALQENSRGFYDLRGSRLGEKRNRQPPCSLDATAGQPYAP
jgi:hypothetical protein